MVTQNRLEPPTQGFSGMNQAKPSPFYNLLLHIDMIYLSLGYKVVNTLALISAIIFFGFIKMLKKEVNYH